MKEKENMLDENKMTLKLEKIGEKTMDKNLLSKNELSRKRSLQEKGITLIALVVTIIILLILAGVTLNMALSQDGLFSKTQEAADKYKQAQEDEELEIEKIEYAAEGKDIKEVEKISDKAGFENFRNEVNEGKKSFENTLVKLYCDVDLANEDWTPIGTPTNPFKGIFNGNGHKIEKLKLVKTESTKNENGNYFEGLFGSNEGIIKNIRIESGSFDSTIDDKCVVGMITGQNSGKVEKCFNKVDITHSNSLGYFGGITGSLQKSGIVMKCYNEGDFILGSETANCHLVGGIVGNGGNIDGGGIYQCYNLGDISCYEFDESVTMIAGIAGIARGEVISCYNKGDITLTVVKSGEEYTPECGGVVGRSGNEKKFTMKNCYNSSKVKIDLKDNNCQVVVGSLIGYSCVDDIIDNNFCFIDDDEKSIGNDRHLEGVTTKSNLNEIENFANKLGEDFIEDTSKINEGFPILAWQVE